MKQTAVEWLESKLKNVEYNPLEKNGYSIAEERLFNQAKEMEKQQKGYSEEEVEQLIHQAVNDSHCKSNRVKYPNSNECAEFVKEWFEQFKNK